MQLVELGEKITSIDLIQIVDKVPVAKTEYAKAYILELNKSVDDIIKNDLDADILTARIKSEKKIKSGFIDFRKSFTAPLNGIVKEFTGIEKEWDEPIDRLQNRLLEMMESVYAETETFIVGEFDRLQRENNDIVPNMEVFSSFIEVQRKNKGMQPNKDGVLGKASTEKILKEFELHVKPIREARELEVLKAKEQKQFEMYIANLEVTGNEIGKIEAALVNLEQLKAQVPEHYPAIKDACIRTIDNRLELGKSNVKTLRLIEEQKEVERQQAVEPQHAEDNPFIEPQVVEPQVVEPQGEQLEVVEVDFRLTDTIQKIKMVKQFMIDNHINYKSI